MQLQTSKFFSTMSMMNRNTQFKSLCQFPSKLFSWSTNSSVTRCSNSYATTTAAPRIAPVNSKPTSNIHGGFSFPSSFLQLSLGPGNLKFNVSSCNSILLQDIGFSTTQYKLAIKSVLDDEFGKNASDVKETIQLKPRVNKGGDKSLTFLNTMRYKTASGYKSVSVTKMGLSEDRVKYYSSKDFNLSDSDSDSDSEEEGNTDDGMNDVNDAPPPSPGPGPGPGLDPPPVPDLDPSPGPGPGPAPAPAPGPGPASQEAIIISGNSVEGVDTDVDMNDVDEEDNNVAPEEVNNVAPEEVNNVAPEEVIFNSDDEEGTGSSNSNEMEVFYHSDDDSTQESSTNFHVNAPDGGAPAAPVNGNENMENAPPLVPEGNNQIDPPVPAPPANGNVPANGNPANGNGPAPPAANGNGPAPPAANGNGNGLFDNFFD